MLSRKEAAGLQYTAVHFVAVDTVMFLLQMVCKLPYYNTLRAAVLNFEQTDKRGEVYG